MRVRERNCGKGTRPRRRKPVFLASKLLSAGERGAGGALFPHLLDYMIVNETRAASTSEEYGVKLEVAAADTHISRSRLRLDSFEAI